MGVWLSQDPLELGNRYGYVDGNPINGTVGEPLFMNGYSYANANPVNIVDPTGLYGESPDQYANTCQQQTPCVSPPSGGNGGEIGTGDGTVSIQREIKDQLWITSRCRNGQPDPEWTVEEIATIEAALNNVQQRGALRAFRNLDIRKANFQPNYGAARTFGDSQSNFIEVYTSGQSLIGTTGSLYHTLLVHELGHVLEKRNDPNMKNTAQTSFDYIAVGSGRDSQIVYLEKIFAQWIPNTDEKTVTTQDIYLQGTYPGSPPPGDGFVVEYIADHFVFWVYQDKVFDSVNIQLDDPPPIQAAKTYIFGGAYEREVNGRIRYSYSPGIEHWVNNA